MSYPVRPRPPYSDMAVDTWLRIAKLPDEKRDRVLERAAIPIFDAGLSPAEADERALLEEAGLSTQRRMVGT